MFTKGELCMEGIYSSEAQHSEATAKPPRKAVFVTVGSWHTVMRGATGSPGGSALSGSEGLSHQHLANNLQDQQVVKGLRCFHTGDTMQPL